MNHFVSLVGLICCGLVLWGATTLSWAQSPKPIGHVVVLQGVVMRRPTDSTTSERLQAQSPVYQADLIQTMREAKVKLDLVDGTILTLGPESALRLTEYVYTPQSRSQKSVLQMFFGVCRIVVQKLLPSGTFKVHTSNAVAAVRGTDWMARVALDATAVVVLAGSVSVRHARQGIGGTVVLTAGMGTDVLDTLAPTAPKRWGASRLDALRQATTLP